LSDKEQRPEQRTLFGVRLGDPRERRQIAGGRARAAAPRRTVATSDVTRVRVIVVAAAAAAAAVVLAWLFVPAAPTRASGAVALPHRAAGLECKACHKENNEPAARACVGCHQAHPSERPAHRELAKRGELGCARCHDVHGADQGVRFLADGEVLRYGVSGEAGIDVAFPAADHDITVPLVPLSRCAPCHDVSAERDPIQRCVLASQRGGEGAINVCFDEHRPASAAVPARPGGVCSAQHDPQRFAAWEAARDAAAVPAPLASGSARATWWWLGAAAMAAFVGGGSVRGWGAWRRRRAARSEEAPALKPAERVRLPQIDTNTCLGCYACVDACPYDVLAIERYVAKVVHPEGCCGLTLCEQVCPNGSLRITDGEPIGERPRLSDALEALDANGVYLAGDVTGLPLIKNAILQGAHAVQEVARALPPKRNGDLDLLIVGAGPAGISAALEAKDRGLRFRVIEQGSVAQSIRSFPRGKLVFDQPLELPLAGKLWLEECTKDELLAKWTRIVREARLPIDEGRRFVGVDRDAQGFTVRAVATEDQSRAFQYRAARVLLAVGVRGSPRRLEVTLDASTENKVFYHLADARSFEGRRVLVVGLGDAAMETAIALAHQPGTEVTVSYRGDGFTRGKPRNVSELKRLCDAGRVRLILRSTVAAIGMQEVTLRAPEGSVRVPNEAVFVMIGSVPPTKLLEQAGVRISPPSSLG
jgi:thioredoxin reductase/NAD-dependent dihydropyrimidine dehydrogenase PreA subunit